MNLRQLFIAVLFAVIPCAAKAEYTNLNSEWISFANLPLDECEANYNRRWSGVIDLNQYDTNHISSVTVSAYAYTSLPHTAVGTRMSASGASDVWTWKSNDTSSSQWTNSYSTFQYTSIHKRSSDGHWIAGQISTPNETLSNVDLGYGYIYYTIEVTSSVASSGVQGGFNAELIHDPVQIVTAPSTLVFGQTAHFEFAANAPSGRLGQFLIDYWNENDNDAEESPYYLRQNDSISVGAIPNVWSNLPTSAQSAALWSSLGTTTMSVQRDWIPNRGAGYYDFEIALVRNDGSYDWNYDWLCFVVAKATPIWTVNNQTWSGSHTLTSADLANAFSNLRNPYSSSVVQPTGSVTYAIAQASGPGATSVGIIMPGSTMLSIGSYVITATYGGDDNYSTATATGTFTVNAFDPNGDDDHDGIPNGWERDHGLDPNNPNDAMADPDGDGLTNIAEYNLGTDPHSANSPAGASLPVAYTSLATGNVTKLDAVGITAGQFSVDKNGAATYSIPIVVSPGTAGMEPKLSLNYSSQVGNGIAGFGWSLSGGSAISRGPQTLAVDGKIHGVDYSSDDRFYLDGQRLIAISGTDGANGTEYRTEIESFSRVVSYGAAGSGPQWFKVWTKAGLILEFGSTSGSRRLASGRNEMMSWSVTKISDTAGNYMTFIYDQDVAAGVMTLRRISYTGHDGSPSLSTYASVRFEYENRADTSFGYIAGSRTAQNVRLKTVSVYVDETVVKTYTLDYVERTGTGRSILTKFTETGMDGKSYPPLTFTYDEVQLGWDQLDTATWAPPLRLGTGLPRNNKKQTGTGFVDVNGDGRPDLVCYYIDRSGGVTRATFLNTPNGWVAADGSNGQPDYRLPETTPLVIPLEAPTIEQVVIGQDQDAGTRFVDFDGDGLVDIIRCYKRGDGSYESYAYRNTGSGWESAPQWCLPQELARSQRFDIGRRFVDLNGDGRVDLVWSDSEFSGDTGACLNTGNGWQAAPQFAPPYYLSAKDNPDTGSRLVDLNGDGLPDFVVSNQNTKGVYLNTGSGWTSINSYDAAQLPAIADSTHSTLGVEVLDVNGDGLPDFIWSRWTGSAWIQGALLNTGRSFVAAPEYIPQAHLGADGIPVGAAFIDVNGDGIPDHVFNRYVSSAEQQIGTYFGTGRGWTGGLATCNLPYMLSQDNKSSVGADLIDLDGDGAIDEVYSAMGNRATFLNRAHSADRLAIVSTGLGMAVAIKYAPLTKPTWDNPDLYTKRTNLDDLDDAERAMEANVTGPMYVVSSVEQDDGVLVGPQKIKSIYTVKYQYGGLRSHRERGSLGFGWMRTVDTRNLTASTTYFRQDYPFVGMPSATVTEGEVNDSNRGKTLSVTYYDYSEANNLPWGGTHFGYAWNCFEQSWDLNGAYLSGTTTSKTYDSYGNALTIDTETVAEDCNLEDYRKLTTNTFDNIVDAPSDTGTSRWYLGRLKRATSTAYGPVVGNGIPSEMSRTSSFDYYDSTTGFLKTETVEPDLASDPANLTLTTTYGYDAFGHKTSAITSGGGMDNRTTSTLYDDQGRFPKSATNALEQTESYGYNQYFGTVDSLTGPNGLTTSWQYDGMGRKILEARPSSNANVPNYTAIRYGWCSGAPSEAVYQIETITPGTTPSLALFDASGRAIYAFGINGGTDGTPCVVGARTWFDNRGHAYATSLPFYYTGSEPSPTFASQTYFDDLSRPRVIYTADDPNSGTTPIYQTTTITYNGREITTTNPRLQVTRSVKNCQGWVVETFTNDNGTGNGIGPERGHVKFAYDPLGQLRTTTVYSDGDTGSVSTSLGYDLRGRKTTMDDADMGHWSYTYDAAGELLIQTDAKLQQTTTAYDVLGRLKTRIEPEGTTTWNYDTAANGIGKLATVSVTADRNKSYSESYTYEALGRPASMTRNINGTAYAQGQTYDDYSRPLITLYPGGYKVGNRYNDLGFLTQVYDARASSIAVLGGDVPIGFVYWQAQGYALNGAVNASFLGNGTTQDRIYSANTGRLQAISSGRGSAIDVQNIVYTYDSIGNVSHRNDTTLGRDESFQDDGLNRLKYSDINNRGSVIDVHYDALGNIKDKTNAGTSYLYGESGHGYAGPHAVTTISGGAFGDRSFTYDANGNLAWDGQRSITYTSYNQVKTITKFGRTTEFWFGAGHERVMQVDNGGSTTTYVGSLLEVVQTGGLTENKHYIYTPAGRVAVRTARSDGTYQTRFLHQDALGSVTTVTDELGAVEQRFTFDPWGQRTQTINYHVGSGGAVTRGFTDHEHLDDFGLIHMNGRVYDPILGRFISADPFVQSPGDSQSYNRYSYCSNNPLNATDPSGYSWFSSWCSKNYGVLNFGPGYLVSPKVFNRYGPQAEAIAIAAVFSYCGLPEVGAAVGGFEQGFNGSLLNGGSIGDSFRSGVVGAAEGWVLGAASEGVGDAFGPVGNSLWTEIGRATAHGLVGGFMSEFDGGDYNHGFWAGFAGSIGGSVAPHLGMGTPGDWSDPWKVAERTAFSATIGGTASALGGGKFANGAVTAAFQHLCNAEHFDLDKASKAQALVLVSDNLQGMGSDWEQDRKLLARDDGIIIVIDTWHTEADYKSKLQFYSTMNDKLLEVTYHGTTKDGTPVADMYRNYLTRLTPVADVVTSAVDQGWSADKVIPHGCTLEQRVTNRDGMNQLRAVLGSKYRWVPIPGEQNMSRYTKIK